MMITIQVIKTEAEYEEALEAIDALLRIDDGQMTEEELNTLEVLSILVEDYENDHYPVPLPDPVDAILFRMEQENLTRQDLQKCLGSASKVSEVLSRKRPLSLSMIRALHEQLEIPLEVLIQDTSVKQEAGVS